MFNGRTLVGRFMMVVISTLLFISFHAAAEEISHESGEPYDVLVNNVFFDVFITDALRDVSLQTNVPILTDTTVSGFVTLDLFDVPLPDALRQLVLPGGYTVRWMDGYYIVGSARPDSPLFHLLSVTERVELRHVAAEDLLSMLIVPFRDRVRVDAGTNSAIVTGPPEVVERIVADIKKIDVPPHQIRIDALITEINSQGREALGLDWSWSDKSSSSASNEVSFSNLVGSIGYTISGGLDRFLLSLRNEVAAGNAHIRANPNLVTLEGKTASLFVGKVTYYRIVSGSESSTTTRLEAIEAGVSLEITARVADDGMIVLNISPSVSDVQGYGDGDLPQIGRRRISTTVRVRDGETIALGGLLQETISHTRSQVPLLGSLPIIGRLFSSERSVTDETELIILITPHILHDA